MDLINMNVTCVLRGLSLFLRYRDENSNWFNLLSSDTEMNIRIGSTFYPMIDFRPQNTLLDESPLRTPRYHSHYRFLGHVEQSKSARCLAKNHRKKKKEALVKHRTPRVTILNFRNERGTASPFAGAASVSGSKKGP